MDNSRKLSNCGKRVPVVSGGTRFGHYIIDNMILQGGMFGIISTIEESNIGGAVFILVLYGVILAYYPVTEGVFKGTPAKLILGNIVINDRAEPINFGNAVIRSLIRYVPFEPFSFLGSDGRGWHDKWSKTYVIRKADLPKVQALLTDDKEIDLFGIKKKDSNFEHEENNGTV